MKLYIVEITRPPRYHMPLMPEKEYVTVKTKREAVRVARSEVAWDEKARILKAKDVTEIELA